MNIFHTSVLPSGTWSLIGLLLSVHVIHDLVKLWTLTTILQPPSRLVCLWHVPLECHLCYPMFFSFRVALPSHFSLYWICFSTTSGWHATATTRGHAAVTRWAPRRWTTWHQASRAWLESFARWHVIVSRKWSPHGTIPQWPITHWRPVIRDPTRGPPGHAQAVGETHPAWRAITRRAIRQTHTTWWASNTYNSS